MTNDPLLTCSRANFIKTLRLSNVGNIKFWVSFYRSRNDWCGFQELHISKSASTKTLPKAQQRTQIASLLGYSPAFPLVHLFYIKQCHLRIFVSTNLQFPLSVVGCLMGAVTLWTNDRGGWVVGEWVTRRRTHILNGPPTISHNRPQSVFVHKLCKT